MLRTTLWEAFSVEPGVGIQIVPGIENIALTNPTETLRQADKRMSLWLYRVEENEFIKNQPLRRIATDDSILRPPPLSLDLSYLITPTTGSPESDLHLLGMSMQVLYENAIIELNNPLEGVREELRIILGRISLEELTRIWEALNEPYRLSVCYRVRVTRIDSARDVVAVPITDSVRGYGADQDAGVGGVNGSNA